MSYRPQSFRRALTYYQSLLTQSLVVWTSRIGRITKGLLLHVAEEVDVVEPVFKFTEELKGLQGVGTIYNVGLQDWQPPHDVQYDLIWTQWCLGHLTDAQVVKYLEVCKIALRPGTGIIVIKENNAYHGVEFDSTDSCVTR